jgi:dGTPase
LTERLKGIDDTDAKISLLRAKSINALVSVCSEVFFKEQDSILAGTFNDSLIERIDPALLRAMKAIKEISTKKIYNYSSVVQIELAGYKVIDGLLEEFVSAYLRNSTKHDKKLVELIPNQFLTNAEDEYSKILSVIDFISGMTDLYAVELFRKIKGISFPSMS